MSVIYCGACGGGVSTYESASRETGANPVGKSRIIVTIHCSECDAELERRVS